MISGTEAFAWILVVMKSWQQQWYVLFGGWKLCELIRTVLFGKIQLKMVQSVLDAGPIRMEVFI